MKRPGEVRHLDLELPTGRVHCATAGEGPAVLLLHGGHGSWTHWVANIGPLARTHRVIAPDLPGFGMSFQPKPAYDMDAYAATVAGLLDVLALERAAVVGFSFGAAVAAASACARPARFTHLAMVNPPGLGPRSPLGEERQRAASRHAVRAGLRAGARMSLETVQLCDHHLIDDPLIDLMTANVRATRFVSRELSLATRTDRLLAGVRQPILLLIGREDPHRQHGLAEMLRLTMDAAPHARIHVLERASHWLQYDRAQAFDRLLGEFLAA